MIKNKMLPGTVTLQKNQKIAWKQITIGCKMIDSKVIYIQALTQHDKNTQIRANNKLVGVYRFIKFLALDFPSSLQA